MKTHDNPPGDSDEGRSQAELLLELSSDAELFHNPENEGHATVPVDSHRATYAIRSKSFKEWLLRKYYTKTKSAPSQQSVQSTLSVLESMSKFEGPEFQVFTRVAEFEGRYYLDLANTLWQVVEVDQSGWRILDAPPVKFRRARGMHPLPLPTSGGTISELRQYVNVASDTDWMLLVAWLVAAIRPKGPYPVLALHGEQGSAKSTTARMLRLLIDPNAADLRSEPRDVRDIMIAAQNGWIVSLDNLSHIQVWLSDALCRLATGGGFSTRELYSDADEVLIEVQRPAILNGIAELATRGDLLDRSLVTYLPPIPQERRLSERTLWQDFEAARPRILGSLLDAVSCALGRIASVNLASRPRLADFAEWIAAAEPALGWEAGSFAQAYSGNRAAANDLALESSLITAPIKEFISHGAFEGTATELLGHLNSISGEDTTRQKYWPASARSLTNILRRLAPNFRQVGVEIDFRRDTASTRDRLISIRKVDATDTGSSEPPPQSTPAQCADELTM